MYIVYSQSKITSIVMYYMGYVETHNDGTAKIQSQWTTEQRFATQFATLYLAQRIADAFSRQHESINFYTQELE